MSKMGYVYKVFFKAGYTIETKLDDSPEGLLKDSIRLYEKETDTVYNSDPIIFRLSDVLYFEKIPQ